MKTLNGKYLPETKGYYDIQFTGAEIFTEVKTYNVSRVCVKCYDGQMVSTGIFYPVSPARYEHECSNCGHKEFFNKSYPLLEYK